MLIPIKNADMTGDNNDVVNKQGKERHAILFGATACNKVKRGKDIVSDAGRGCVCVCVCGGG